MLEDLAVCDVGNAQIIRIGKDEKLTELVKTRYAVDYAKERWISSIIEKSKEQITSELKALSINEHEFYEYSDAHAKSQSHNLSSKEENKTNKTITIFETKYSELIKTKKSEDISIYSWILWVTSSFSYTLYAIIVSHDFMLIFDPAAPFFTPKSSKTAVIFSDGTLSKTRFISALLMPAIEMA